MDLRVNHRRGNPFCPVVSVSHSLLKKYSFFQVPRTPFNNGTVFTRLKRPLETAPDGPQSRPAVTRVSRFCQTHTMSSENATSKREAGRSAPVGVAGSVAGPATAGSQTRRAGFLARSTAVARPAAGPSRSRDDVSYLASKCLLRAVPGPLRSHRRFFSQPRDTFGPARTSLRRALLGNPTGRRGVRQPGHRMSLPRPVRASVQMVPCPIISGCSRH